MTELTLQNMVALSKANEYRIAKSADKKRIARGELDPLAVLENPPPHWRKAPVIELLMAMHRVGRSRAGSWLTMADVMATKPIGEMTPAQRHRLTSYVRYGQATPGLPRLRPPLS